MHLHSIRDINKEEMLQRPTDALRQIKIPNVIFTDETTVPILYTFYGQAQLLEVVTNMLPVKSRVRGF